VTGGGPEEEASRADRLDLADWRRRISDLYLAVRAEAAIDPEAACRRWCEIREELFRIEAGERLS
jgi:hypothetical protein